MFGRPGDLQSERGQRGRGGAERPEVSKAPINARLGPLEVLAAVGHSLTADSQPKPS